MSTQARGREHSISTTIMDSEDVIIQKVVAYAKQGDFTKYTSTLDEAWRISVQELSKIVCENIDRPIEELELTADETYDDDPIAAFGILESERHRSRGTPLPMFLALYKYYLQSYLDLIETLVSNTEAINTYQLKITRIFDSIELAYLKKWVSLDDENLLQELQSRNRLLTNEKNKFLTMMESLQIPMLYIDSDLKLKHINSSGGMFLKGSPLPEPWYYLDDKGEIKIPEWLLERIQEFENSDESVVTFEQRLPDTQKDIFYSIHIAKMQDISDKYQGYSISGQDISERKLAELSLSESERKQRDISAQLAASNDMKDLLLDIITHDLANPAGTVHGAITLKIQEDTEDELLQLARESSESLISVLQNATSLAKVSMDEEISLSEIDLVQSVELVVREYQSSLDTQGIELQLHAPKSVSVMANPIISEVFRNYLSNAIKYAADGRKIDVGIDVSPEMVTLEVKDFGHGIPQERYKDIFIRRVQLSEGKQKGRGLGLAIVKKIAEAHNAEVGVHPNQPQGNVFYLNLPRV